MPSTPPATLPQRRLIDGTDRAAVFAALESFDHRNLPREAFQQAALKLISSSAGARDAGALYEHVRTRWAQQPPVHEALAKSGDDADAILEHRFSFYDEAHTLGAVIDWEHNPGSAHWGHDLNRFGYLRTLTAAHARTGDVRYARKVVTLILDWIGATDIADAFVSGRSRYVWSSYLNTAIHLEAWSEALAHVLAEAPEALSPDELLSITKSVHDQLTYLWIVIPEKHNNWVTIGCRSVLATVARFGFLKVAAWQCDAAWQRLDEAVQSQTLPDGVQDELTAGYHMVVVRNVLKPLSLQDWLPTAPPSGLRATLVPMLRYIRHALTPDGRLVNFNDSDASGGAAVEALLASPTARELLGEELDAPRNSTQFPYAGLAILRQGSERGRDELYLAFDAGPFGMAHQHEDKLGFWLSAYGRPLIVDAGRHLYDPSPEAMRAYLNSTRAHSTIMIDGQGQASRDFRETWRSSEPIDLKWQEEGGNVSVTGRYDLGYGEDHIAVTHERRIQFVADPGYYLIEDLLEGSGSHLVESRLQFAPGQIHVEANRIRTCYEDANLLVLLQPGQWEGVHVELGQKDPPGGWYSEGYNRLAPAPAAVMRVHISQWPARRSMLLLPYRGAEPPAAFALPAGWSF